MKKITLYILTFLLLFCFYCTPAYAKTTSYSVLQGKTIKIKNTKKNLKWSSSDKSIATVSKNGKVTGVKLGTCKIYAKTKKSTYTYKIIVSNYTVKKTGKRRYPNIVTINTPTGKKTYKAYSQVGFGSSYLCNRGCSHTAAAIVMSAYGKNYTPLDIHNGSVNKKCSERYAKRKLHMKVSVSNNKSLSVYSVSQILKNVGINNHPVFKYSNNSAIEEITNNLKAGRPVLIITHRKKVKGIKLANSYHFLVLIGIDGDGKAIVINPVGGVVNRSQCTGAYKIPVSQIVKNHMWSCTGKGYKNFHFNGTKNYGGYIVIDR